MFIEYKNRHTLKLRRYKVFAKELPTIFICPLNQSLRRERAESLVLQKPVCSL